MNSNFDLKRFLGFMLIVVIPLVSYNIEGGRWRSLHLPFLYTAHTFQLGYTWFSDRVIGNLDEYLNLLHLKKQHEEYQRRLAYMHARIARYEEIRRENQRLRKILELKDSTEHKLVVAEVISFDALPDMEAITINKGSQQGLSKHMGILSESGNIVGYLTEVLKKTSTALLITDRYAVIDAMVQRSRVRGLLEGRSPSTLQLKSIRRSDDVLKGDLVVTSPFSERLPKGLPLGIIESAKNDAFNISKRVIVRPLEDLSRLERVLVIRKVVNDSENQNDSLNSSSENLEE